MFMMISMTQQVSKAKWRVANPWHIIIFADSIPMIGWLAYLRVVTLMFPDVQLVDELLMPTFFPVISQWINGSIPYSDNPMSQLNMHRVSNKHLNKP